MSTAKNIMSMTSLRRTIQRMEQLTAPVAGTNSERLKTKRRAQMLAGKLGHVARVHARMAYSRIAIDYAQTDGLIPLLHEPGRVTLELAKQAWLEGKELTHAESNRTEPTHPASS